MNVKVPPGYKQTEMGITPEDWPIATLGSLSEYITSGSRGWARFYSKYGALFVRSQNIRAGKLDLKDTQFVTAPPGSEGTRTQVKINDILITITGNSVGNVALVEHELGEAYISQHVGLVRLQNPLIGNFVCWFLSPGSPGNIQISASQSGQSKPGLNLGNLQGFQVTLPPLSEQQAIVEALSDTDSLIESLEQLVAKKRHIKQGTMRELLTGKKRLPGFSGEWEVKRLGDVVEINKGQLITESDAVSGGIPVIAGGKKPAYFHDKANRTGKTITVSASGASAGFIAFFDSPIFASDCSTISEGKEYSIEFIYFQLLLRQEAIYKAQTGGAQPHIHPVNLMPLRIEMATVEEQTAIAKVLCDMDAEISELESQLAKTLTLKQGMMHKLLTGEIRLL